MRRVTRVGPAAAGLGPLAASLSAGVARAGKAVTSLTTTATVPPTAYARPVITPIVGGYGAAVVPAGGKVSISVGPQGLGTIWYPQSAAIATTTGAADASTVTVYIGPLGLQTQIGGQSYSGGASSVGLPVPAMWPGYFVFATWTGANPGDLATLTVYGTQSALVA